MCYDVKSGLMAAIKYARHRHYDSAEIDALESKLKKWLSQGKSHHYVSGFAHPKLMVFTNERPLEPQSFIWGLVPSWVKDGASAKALSNQTLNARGETIFEKPSFRTSAKSKRCLVYIDGFYEHHHSNGKTFPFHIKMLDGSPLSLAGLWDEWVNKETGEVVNSVSIVTTKGNPQMSKIHNNPKLEEPRMPVILPKDKQEDWLAPYQSDQDKIALSSLMLPFEENMLAYFTVPRLKGKEAVGDSPEAEKLYIYEELTSRNN